jgi:hypothetical protein
MIWHFRENFLVALFFRRNVPPEIPPPPPLTFYASYAPGGIYSINLQLTKEYENEEMEWKSYACDVPATSFTEQGSLSEPLEVAVKIASCNMVLKFGNV